MASSRSPTLETLLLFVIVFALQGVTSLVGLIGLFVLAPPITANPWTIVTSVYAHGSIPHLLSNSLALLLAGLLVERRTTRLRFHLFFLTVGALAGITQVVSTGLLGPGTAVLGASGAVFGLFGYLLAGNVVASTLLDRIRLPPRAQFALFALAALVVTIATGRPGVALVAHFTGLLLGLLAGAAGVLDT
ncbi:rhomboid family intramembrane serine protease [Halohasta litorea]|uniref:Rhomboid family intramembrane serine protease n=1 Tax=Halohasta litorea TaxID=869891 RepID=A0ABD6D6N7_9EURY|nr:rhomboid family intramembrane serine protease [Halohasta litorea]